MKVLVSVLISLALFLPLSMKSQATEFYRIDLMMVAYQGEQYWGSEKWPMTEELQAVNEPQEELPEAFEPEGASLDDMSALDDEAATELETEEAKEEVLIKPAAGHIFKSASERINYREDMQVIWQQAWIEKIQDAENAILHPIEEVLKADILDGNTRISLTGNVSFYKSRYLHIHPDLIIEHQQLVENKPEDATLTSDSYTKTYRWKAIRAAKIDTSRRMRSQERHYLDHPLLGIVVKVSPVLEELDGNDTKKADEDSTDANTGISQ